MRPQQGPDQNNREWKEPSLKNHIVYYQVMLPEEINETTCISFFLFLIEVKHLLQLFAMKPTRQIYFMRPKAIKILFSFLQNLSHAENKTAIATSLQLSDWHAPETRH